MGKISSENRAFDSHAHYVIRCSCGVAIDMCWCGSTVEREETIVENGCAKCSRKVKSNEHRRDDGDGAGCYQ